MVSAPGGPFHSPEADRALFDAIKAQLRNDIPVYEIDADINDRGFARAMAEGLIELMRIKK